MTSAALAPPAMPWATIQSQPTRPRVRSTTRSGAGGRCPGRSDRVARRERRARARRRTTARRWQQHPRDRRRAAADSCTSGSGHGRPRWPATSARSATRGRAPARSGGADPSRPSWTAAPAQECARPDQHDGECRHDRQRDVAERRGGVAGRGAGGGARAGGGRCRRVGLGVGSVDGGGADPLGDAAGDGVAGTATVNVHVTRSGWPSTFEIAVDRTVKVPPVSGASGRAIITRSSFGSTPPRPIVAPLGSRISRLLSAVRSSV